MSRAAVVRAAVARHRATGAPVSLVLREPAAVAAWARLRSLAGSTGVPLVTLAGRALAAGVADLFGEEPSAPEPQPGAPDIVGFAPDGRMITLDVKSK